MLFLNKKYILASKSPRRIELLQRLIPEFEIVPSTVEEIIPKNKSFSEIACDIAEQKVKNVGKNYLNEVILGFDTIVVVDDKIFGKPKSRNDAIEMLKALSGKKHLVITGCAVKYKDQIDKFYQQATVNFANLSIEEIETYIETGEPFDKAGAYGIQGFGARYIKSIEGDFYAVMGLPISKLYQYLKGLDL